MAIASKMLGIYFEKQYGTSNLGYPVTPQRKRNSYKSFALRASGSDWSYTMFRDILGHHTTLLNMDVDIMGYKPSIVYVNGQYMGIHNIREKVDDDFIEKSFNLEPGSFDLVENEDYAEAGNLDAYNSLLQLLSNDLSDNANYNAVANVLDIENFTDYVITEMAVANTSINHNVMAWKPKNGGKWRWVLMDVDRGFFNYTENLIGFYENQSVWPFRKLLENAAYKAYFGKRLAAQLFTSFNPQQMNALIDEHKKIIEDEIPNHIERWLGTTSSYGDAMPSVDYWEGEVNDLRTFVNERPAALLNDLQNYGFEGTAILSLAISPENAGTIKLDSLKIPNPICSGSYLKNINIQLVEENKPGYKFLGWTSSTSKNIVAKESVWKYNDTAGNLGSNTLAVEVHQNVQSSANISFDLELNCNIPGSAYVSVNSEYNFTLTDDTFLIAMYEKTSNCVVPEVISENLTLNVDCSPYLVQGNVTINENAVLTIEPGVEILMPKDASITVNGAIIANGTAQEKIYFKLNPDYANATWGIILFKNTPQPSILNHVTIEDASKGYDQVTEIAAISAFHATLVMDNLIIENVAANPITARYSDIILTNSSLRSRVTGDLINVKYGKARIENSKFEGCSEPDNDGIDYDEIENGVIKNCILTNFTGTNCDAIDIGEKASNIFIDSVSAFNITDKGVSLGQRSSATIKNSIFVNCTKGVALKDSSHATINNCVFYNTVDAIACYEKNLGSAGGNANVTNSILSNASNTPFFVDAKSTLVSSYCLTDTLTSQKNSSNLTGNPLFVNPTFFNFHLMPNSPAIMAGNDTNGNQIDLGATAKYTNFQPSVMIYQLFVNAEALNFPEFITLYNPSSEQVDLGNYTITKGITLLIPEGTFIEANDIIYLTDDATSNSWQQQTKQVVQWESGHLSNNGETLQLNDNHTIVVDFLNYQNNGLWPSDGFLSKGILQLISTNTDNHFPESWKSGNIDLILDTTDIPSLEKLIVYPNPASSEITIKGFDFENETIEIYNISGQMVGKSQLNSKGVKTLDISNYPNGMFFVKVGENVQKLLKMN